MKASELPLLHMANAPRDQTILAWVTFCGDYGYTDDEDKWAAIHYYEGWRPHQPTARHYSGIKPIGWLLILDDPGELTG